MAADKYETQITWSSSNSVTLNSTSWFVSDAFTPDDADWAGSLALRADHAGTPATTCQVEVKILYSNGDLDNGGGADDYPEANTSGTTAAQGNPAAVLDTYSYDPDAKSVPLDLESCKSLKIAARATGWASGRNIVLSARILTNRGAIA